MISISIALVTFRKQWTLLDLLKNVDETLTKNFSVITPKQIYNQTIKVFILAINLFLAILIVATYILYENYLRLPSLFMCISYYLVNLPYAAIILFFYFSTSTISRRFHYVNNILRQLSSRNIPKDKFEICSRTDKNERHTPTISLHEIYSIYGNNQIKKPSPFTPPNKNFKSKDEMETEIKKLTSKLANNEEGWMTKWKRKDIIEVEEMKLSKIDDVDQVIEYLTKLIDVHDDLLDCLTLQNELVSFQILLVIGQIFVFSVFAWFSLYRTMFNAEAVSSVLAFVNVFWITIYNLVLGVIMAISNKCVKEGRFTGTAVHKVINKIAHSADARVIEKVSSHR